MFTHDMLESRQREVTIKGIDPSAMESLIQFAYSGKVTIHPGNVHNLMIGASYLQLNQVREACADYFKQRLESSNVLSIRTFAENLVCYIDRTCFRKSFFNFGFFCVELHFSR